MHDCCLNLSRTKRNLLDQNRLLNYYLSSAWVCLKNPREDWDRSEFRFLAGELNFYRNGFEWPLFGSFNGEEKNQLTNWRAIERNNQVLDVDSRQADFARN